MVRMRMRVRVRVRVREMGFWGFWGLWVVCIVLSAAGTVSAQTARSEEFSEDLLLRPMPDGKVLGHFLFTNHLPPLSSHEHHHRLFPKAIYQLVQKFHIREMELSFTQGRWDYARWGGLGPVASTNAKPAGVELWALFNNHNDEVDALWRNLTHALSGLFCASINFLESPSMVSNPLRGFRPDLGFLYRSSMPGFSKLESALRDGFGGTANPPRGGLREGTLGASRYGALPREAVCTENLTPWLKLLPCRDKAGLATLLERSSVYNRNYHSLRVHVRSGDLDENGQPHQGVTLQQSLTLIMKPPNSDVEVRTQDVLKIANLQPNWSLDTLFTKPLLGRCPVAKSSHVHLELEGSLVDELLVLQDATGKFGSQDSQGLSKQESSQQRSNLKEQGAGTVELGVDTLNVVNNAGFLLNATPDRVLKEYAGVNQKSVCVKSPLLLLIFEVKKYSRAHPLNLGMFWRGPISWSPCQGPFRATRFLTGSGNERGSIVLVVNANGGRYSGSCSKDLEEKSQPQVGGADEGSSEIDIIIFQMAPWYLRLYMHSLKVVLNGHHVDFLRVVKWMRVVPSEDRKSPAVLEVHLSVPKNTSMLSLKVEFDKGFLRIDEHPPDANLGFDLPSTLFTFSRSQTAQSEVPASVAGVKSQLLLEDWPVQIYCENLLVPLATPDFSMPYNVITFTMTVFALYFGSLLNALRR